MQSVSLNNTNPIYFNGLKNGVNNPLGMKLNENRIYFDFQADNKNLNTDKFEVEKQNSEQTKVSFGEGAKLVAGGFVNKVKNIGKSIIEHPVRTIGTVAVATAALSALPLVGISSAAGAAGLAIGAAAIAVGKTAAHGIKAVQHNRAGEYNLVRDDLQNIGGDCVDVALSLPFVPKAVKTVKSFAKYGKIGLNSELISELKAAKGIKAKADALKGGNFKIIENVQLEETYSKYFTSEADKAEFIELKNMSNGDFANAIYKKTVQQMNVEDIAPDFSLKSNMASNEYGGFTSADGKIGLNADWVKTAKKTDIMNYVRHELEHFNQYSDIARAKGSNAIAEALAEGYIRRLQTGDTGLDLFASNNKKLLDRIGADEYKKLALEQFDRQGSINKDFYNRIIQTKGKIEAGTQEAARAEEYYQAAVNYPNLSFSFFGPPESYINNILEVNARAAGENLTGEIGNISKVLKEAGQIKDTYTTDIVSSNLRTQSALAKAEA